MNRDIEGMVKDFDVVVIGGGIVGAATFRELCMSGLNVLLVEKDDFCNDISSGSTEMAHGGFRYLLTLKDWSLVIESIVERETLHYIAPHLVSRLNFYMPLYAGDEMYFNPSFPGMDLPDVNWRIGGYGGLGTFMVGMGMNMYKLFALYGIRSRKLGSDVSEVGYEKLHSGEILSRGFNLNPEGLTACYKYTDSNIEDVERLVVETILSGLDYADCNGGACAALNRTEFAGFADGGELVIRCLDDDWEFRVKPRAVVNATGANINAINDKLENKEANDIHMIAGAHLIVPRSYWNNDDRRAAVAWWINKKIMFAISKGTDRLLLGTHERYIPAEEVDKRNYNYREDLDTMLEKTRKAFPGLDFDVEDYCYYTRVRPLKPDEKHLAGGGNPTRFSRRDYLRRIGNVISVSGKLGPSRCLAEHVARTVFEILDRPAPASITSHEKLSGGHFEGTVEDYIPRAAAAFPAAGPQIVENVVRRFGSAFLRILSNRPEGALAPVDPECPDSQPMASLLYAFEQEGARNMTHAFRRTGAYKHLSEGLNCIENATQFVGRRMGWDDARVQSEIENYKEYIAERRIIK
mgnify:CR=1 FL=1